MGTVVLNGATSGGTTIAPADAVTVSLTLPGASGTLLTTAGNLANATGLPLTTGVSGILPIANGGTGQTSLSAVTVGNATNAATATSATTATNLAGGGAGQVPYNTGSGATSFLAAGTSGYYLKSNATGAPSWAAVCAAPPTTYGAVGTYVAAYYNNGGTGFTRPGCTVSGGCLYRLSDAMMSNNTCYRGGGMNSALSYYCAAYIGRQCSSLSTSLGLSGTWRTMTTSKQQYSTNNHINLWVRVS
jgi:hypothetical protein